MTVTDRMLDSTIVVSEVIVPSNYVRDATPQITTVKNGANTLICSSGNTDSGSGDRLTFLNGQVMVFIIYLAVSIPPQINQGPGKYLCFFFRNIGNLNFSTFFGTFVI